MPKTIDTNSVLDYIKGRVLNFSLLPGVKISDEEIAGVFGISRSPVREALNRLVEQGLVEYRRNRGFTVKVYKRKEVADHYVLREALECLAVRLATESMGTKEIKSVKKLLATYPSIIESRDITRFDQVDEQFHDMIAFYSNNAALHRVLKLLNGIIRTIRRYDHLRFGSFENTFEEHQLIFKHMVRKDAEGAARLMSHHIIKSMTLVMSILPEQS